MLRPIGGARPQLSAFESATGPKHHMGKKLRLERERERERGLLHVGSSHIDCLVVSADCKSFAWLAAAYFQPALQFVHNVLSDYNIQHVYQL